MGRGRRPGGGQRTRGARPPMMAQQIQPAPPTPRRPPMGGRPMPPRRGGPVDGIPTPPGRGERPMPPKEERSFEPRKELVDPPRGDRPPRRQQTRGGRPPRWEQTIGGKPTNSLNAFRSLPTPTPTPRRQQTRGARPPRWEQTIGGRPPRRGGRGGRDFLRSFFRSGRR